jgi:hypothetical protein
MRGHRHKLESESVGPYAANDVANNLASMLDAERDRDLERLLDDRIDLS